MTDVKWWDATIPEDAVTDEQLQNYLDELCTKWAYEHEIGAGGYKHIQLRCVFKVGKQLSTIKNQIPIASAHWSKTQSISRNFDYVEKDGCVIRSWEKVLRPFMTMELLPWQEQAMEMLENQNDRGILIIVDEVGGAGKTTFGKVLEATHKADVCPVCDGDASNYIEYCLNHVSKGYVFDVPKADSIQSKKAMWRAIEQIKNGLLYDRRYTSRKMWIEPPKIVVFANEYPPVGYLSHDRWNVYKINRYIGNVKGLQRYEPVYPSDTKDEWEWTCVSA